MVRTKIEHLCYDKGGNFRVWLLIHVTCGNDKQTFKCFHNHIRNFQMRESEPTNLNSTQYKS